MKAVFVGSFLSDVKKLRDAKTQRDGQGEVDVNTFEGDAVGFGTSYRSRGMTTKSARSPAPT